MSRDEADGQTMGFRSHDDAVQYDNDALAAKPAPDWQSLYADALAKLRRAHELLDKHCVANLDGGNPASLETRINELYSWYFAASQPESPHSPPQSTPVAPSTPSVRMPK